MKKEKELKQILNIGKITNIVSAVYTLILCMPLPFLIFVIKNLSSPFSILNRFRQYQKNELDELRLRRAIVDTKIRIILFGVLLLPFLFIMMTESTTNQQDRAFFSIIFLITLLSFTACYILCVKVKRYISSSSTSTENAATV